MVDEAIRLLERGLEHRTGDYRMPFYLGFNYFYFKNDRVKAAEYLTLASKIPDTPPMVATLAARFSYESGQTESAILFLEEILKNLNDPVSIETVKVRIKGLRMIRILEKATEIYKERQGRLPRDLEELVTADILRMLPTDPYGGDFYLGEDGTIRTTSNLAHHHPSPPSP